MADNPPKEASMATANWRDIDGNILFYISRLLNSDLHLLRLRAVCKPWRSILPPPPPNPVSFPLGMPPFYGKGYITLYQITYYRLSPPEIGPHAGDPSDGWLFKISDTRNPNTFTLLPTPTPQKTIVPIQEVLLPKRIDFYDYRISELRKSYAITFHDNSGCRASAKSVDKICKAVGLWNYVADSEFIAVVMGHDRRLRYWRVGSEGNWITLQSGGDSTFEDLIVYDGIFYAINSIGQLVYLDSELDLVAASSPFEGYSDGHFHSLVESESGLHALSLPSVPGTYFNDVRNLGAQFVPNFEVIVNRFAEGEWCYDVGDLGDTFFLLCGDATLCMSAKDFRVCRRKSAYMIGDCFYREGGQRDLAMIYHLDDRKAFALAICRGSHLTYWCPSSWFQV